MTWRLKSAVTKGWLVVCILWGLHTHCILCTHSKYLAKYQHMLFEAVCMTYTSWFFKKFRFDAGFLQTMFLGAKM